MSRRFLYVLFLLLGSGLLAGGNYLGHPAPGNKSGTPAPAGQRFKYTNHLIGQTSPYLLAHAHNPVNWYPWGNAALQRARTEQKPILLSIGYSACHWCHVMEREDFENETIARLMNADFICIKVDREERPDLDEIYMTAVEAMTGSGGWPLTVFLTPDLKPFYGGTYFPPEAMPGLTSFPQVLKAVAHAWQTQRSEIETSAGQLVEQLKHVNITAISRNSVDAALLKSAARRLESEFDTKHGGFASAPKFPDAMALEFLLRYWKQTGDAKALLIVTTTLHAMARGGIYDQLGGGFHRYAVDAAWRIPHFEKMLYSNALLAHLYADAYLATKDKLFARVGQETLDYLLREMRSKNGGFYASQDADSGGEEGKYYVWSPVQIAAVLGKQTGKLVCRYFNVTDQGNFSHGTSTLAIRESVTEFAASEHQSTSYVQQMLTQARGRLLAARSKRVPPRTDDKIIAAWNGLVISALAAGYRTFDDRRFLAAAQQAARFVLDKLQTKQNLQHSFCAGKTSGAGYLDDYACMVNGLVDLYQADFDPHWLHTADRLADLMLDKFWRGDRDGFFYTEADDNMVIRPRNEYDDAMPSGNSMATLALQRLALLLDRDRYRKVAAANLRLAGPRLGRYPHEIAEMLSAADFYLAKSTEIVIAGNPGNSRTQALLRTVNSVYLPNAVTAEIFTRSPATLSSQIPLLAGKTEIAGNPAAYVCRNYACRTPVTTSDALRRILQ